MQINRFNKQNKEGNTLHMLLEHSEMFNSIDYDSGFFFTSGIIHFELNISKPRTPLNTDIILRCRLVLLQP